MSTTMAKIILPNTSESYSTDGQDENVQAKVNESHILQERRIGIFGAVSLIVNKIVGAGYVNYSIGSEKCLTLIESFPRLVQSSS